MPVMSRVERAFCQSAPWRAFTRRTVVPWASRGHILHGEVLELGSGSGAIAADLVDRYPITHLVATDVDPRMVASAERRLARYVPRVDVRRVDATALPFPDASFDVVASFLMLHHVIDWEQALAEVVRVLRPGGMFVGYDLVDTAPARLLHRLDRSPHRLLTPEALRTELTRHQPAVVELDRSLAGLVFRFHSTKSDGADHGVPTLPPVDRRPR